MLRRTFLSTGATIASVAATRALAAPILSSTNFGITLPAARKRNAWMEINADAFESNIDAIRALIGSTRLCAVMKADAYGNSVGLLMPSILKMRVSDVAIASNDEAKVARQLGYRGRLIRVRTATSEEMEDGFRFGIEELVANPEAASVLQTLYARRKEQSRLSVHLAINCGGMSRNGLELSTAYGKSDARALLALSRLRIMGVMTHYPTEDPQDILDQLGRYQQNLMWLQGEGLNTNRLVRHTANSFATLKQKQTWLDMVRVGALIYGDPGSVSMDGLVPTMAIKSRVAAINHYPAGQTVNYDRTYKLERESWLANVPIGYSDGYRRDFSHSNRPEFAAEERNRTEVLIRGRRFAVVGRVTMNTLMIDVTDGRNSVRPDDEVVLLGLQGRERITKIEFETNSSAFGWEMLAVLGATLPRVLAERMPRGTGLQAI
jgi:alanine racemase